MVVQPEKMPSNQAETPLTTYVQAKVEFEDTVELVVLAVLAVQPVVAVVVVSAAPVVAEFQQTAARAVEVVEVLAVPAVLVVPVVQVYTVLALVVDFVVAVEEADCKLVVPVVLVALEVLDVAVVGCYNSVVAAAAVGKLAVDNPVGKSVVVVPVVLAAQVEPVRKIDSTAQLQQQPRKYN